jgi:uncharacterized membrane protein
MKAVSLLIVAGCAVSAIAAPPSLWNLGGLPGGTGSGEAFGVSPNGLAVAGGSSNGVANQGGFVYKIGIGMIDLSTLPGGPVVGANAVNDNDDFAGSRIVTSFQGEAVKGNLNGSTIRLGGFVVGGTLGSAAYAISADGSVVVGEDETSTVLARSARWVGTTNNLIPFLDGGGSFAYALGMTPDGATVVGQSDSNAGYQGFVWTAADGTVALQDLGSGGIFEFTSANAISADAQVIVGSSDNGTGTTACRWNSIGAVTSLGDLPGGSQFSEALAVNADGSVIVGRATPVGTAIAAVWINSGSPQRLDTYLQSFGIDTTGWVLQRAAGVSADGKTIVGSGTFNGVVSAFRAYVGDPCAGDLNLDGSTDFGDFLLFFNGFDTGGLWADVDGDNEVTFGDFLAFFNAFDTGC